MIDPESTDVPTPLTQKSLSEQLKERLDNKLDAWTIRWIKGHIEEWMSKFSEVIKAYRGVCHTINLITVDVRDLITRSKKQDDKIADNTSLMNATAAKMGEVMAENVMLREDVATLRAKNESMGRWAANLEAWAVKQGKPPYQKETPNAGQN